MERFDHLSQAGEAAATKMIYGGSATAAAGGGLSFTANLEVIQSVLGIIAIVVGMVFTVWGFIRQGRHQKELQQIARENKEFSQGKENG